MRSNKRSVFLFLMAFIFTAAITQAGTLTQTYGSSITPGELEGGLGTIKSGGSSVTITPTSISAISDSASTESAGTIIWTTAVPVTVTLTFKYQIKNPGGSSVIWVADWFNQTIEYTDGAAKTFSQTFDIYDRIVVSVKAKSGSVSIDSVSVQ